MPNPSHLLLDTDALLQVLIARQWGLLSRMRQRCNVLPAVVPEVEREVCWNRAYKSQFEEPFLKTVRGGNIAVLEEQELRNVLKSRGAPADAVEAHMTALDKLCQLYHAHVGEGEAYTHATAATLALPVLSNDGRAITTLVGLGMRVGCPTLRFIDLLIFGRSLGWVDDDNCEKACRALEARGEHLPAGFQKHGAFAEIWQGFRCRLSSNPGVGVAAPTAHDASLFLEVSPI